MEEHMIAVINGKETVSDEDKLKISELLDDLNAKIKGSRGDKRVTYKKILYEVYNIIRLSDTPTMITVTARTTNFSLNDLTDITLARIYMEIKKHLSYLAV